MVVCTRTTATCRYRITVLTRLYAVCIVPPVHRMYPDHQSVPYHGATPYLPFHQHPLRVLAPRLKPPHPQAGPGPGPPKLPAGDQLLQGRDGGLGLDRLAADGGVAIGGRELVLQRHGQWVGLGAKVSAVGVHAPLPVTVRVAHVL